MKTSIGIDCEHHKESDPYPAFEKSIHESFDRFKGEPLFTTNVGNLFDIFLLNLQQDERQYYNCNACRHFINKYGGLVTISKDGVKIPVMWQGYIPDFFKVAVSCILNIVLSSKVNGVFLSRDKVLGTPVTGTWTHMHAHNNSVYSNRLHDVQEVIAEKKADFELLKRSLKEYPIHVVDQAVLFLRTNSLYRSEKVLGIAEWFKNLHDECKTGFSSVPHYARHYDDLVWRAVALAPPGYCHVKNTMIGTLLDDIVSGMGFEMASKRFEEKMNPTKYQRPKVAPTAGNIERAEKIVEKLGIQSSLERRFATLSELRKIWIPMVPLCSPHPEGVFFDVKPKATGCMHRVGGVPQASIPQQNITFRSFAERVLPVAESIEIKIGTVENFCAILTTVDVFAPPIIQWDTIEQRNPFSWYVYPAGSYPSKWNVSSGWAKVTGICYQPSMWFGKNEHHGKSAIFVIEGCKDTSYKTAGNGLFPEILKSDLREVRATIEAYSRKARLHGYRNATACGIRLQDSHNNRVVVRVTTDVGVATYNIDRWE